jgi:4-diphosphocytidyl-2-C-methyl-D-erythritol kinase
MVSVDLADELALEPGGEGLEVILEPPAAAGGPTGPENLITRALAAVGRRAHVRLVKRIPVGGGLGGGSADAAAVLRWAGVNDPELAVSLGADVPFCVVGGRAEVTGAGERVRPLDFEARSYVLVLPPFGVDTAAVYRAWDELARPGGPAGAGGVGPNHLAAAALAVEPRLAGWRDRLAEASGRVPVLAGSGSTWFVEGTPGDLGLAGRRSLSLDGAEAPLVAVRTVPAGWPAS